MDKVKTITFSKWSNNLKAQADLNKLLTTGWVYIDMEETDSLIHIGVKYVGVVEEKVEEKEEERGPVDVWEIGIYE